MMGVRAQKVGGQIQREIAEMLLRGEIHSVRGEGLISVTEVMVSGDMQVATVYVTAYGDKKSEGGPPAELHGIEALQRASGYIRSQLGRRMRLRKVPELRFKEDTSLEYGNRMEKLLGSLTIPATSD
ncbi:MAG: 30S ribosome-binding factor RbfA [Magnetococcales bacterium]|nr:30S ribosome-binding factor RbfA [Magnetococcales bacterium]